MRFNDAILNDICGERISENIYRDNNGQLICANVVLARTGEYDYRESELFDDGSPDKIVKVYRSPEEVFAPDAIKSMNYKPFVDEHPDDNVTPDTVMQLHKGFMTNVRRGEGEFDNCLIADLVVTDPDLIDVILSGKKRELSVGYTADIDDSSGRYEMKNIRGNHIALCEAGRAGNAKIRDKKTVFDAHPTIKKGDTLTIYARGKEYVKTVDYVEGNFGDMDSPNWYLEFTDGTTMHQNVDKATILKINGKPYSSLISDSVTKKYSIVIADRKFICSAVSHEDALYKVIERHFK